MMINSAILDTNILVRLVVHSDPEHPVVLQALRACIIEDVELYITSQNLYETWSVLTRPLSSNGYGVSVEETEAVIQRLCSLFPVLYDDDAVMRGWTRLCRTYEVLGRQAHDARLAAHAISRGIEAILTLNPSDFSRYTGLLLIVHPSTVISSENSSDI